MRHRRFCREGHDLNALNARHWNGGCKICEPAPTHCKKGHDITGRGAAGFHIRPDGRVRMVCNECAQIYRLGRKSRREHCPKGHVVNVPGTTHADGSCKRCRQERKAAEALNGKPIKRTVKQDREDIGRTREMLAVAEKLNRNPMPWEREQLEAEYQQLLRGSA